MHAQLCVFWYHDRTAAVCAMSRTALDYIQAVKCVVSERLEPAPTALPLLASSLTTLLHMLTSLTSSFIFPFPTLRPCSRVHSEELS